MTEGLEARLEPTETLLSRLTPLNPTNADVEREQARSERRHQASLAWAGQVGHLIADLSSVRSQLTGLLDGAIPSMREHGAGIYQSPELAFEHVLSWFEDRLIEMREDVTGRLGRAREFRA